MTQGENIIDSKDINDIFGGIPEGGSITKLMGFFGWNGNQHPYF